MATTMDNSITHHDDLNLMGMQELDSTMSIFESSHVEGSPISRSSSYDTPSSFNYISPYSHTITVQTPFEPLTKLEQTAESDQIHFAETRFVPPIIALFVSCHEWSEDASATIECS